MDQPSLLKNQQRRLVIFKLAGLQLQRLLSYMGMDHSLIASKSLKPVFRNRSD
jgi:hypothetical protein